MLDADAEDEGQYASQQTPPSLALDSSPEYTPAASSEACSYHSAAPDPGSQVPAAFAVSSLHMQLPLPHGPLPLVPPRLKPSLRSPAQQQQPSAGNDVLIPVSPSPADNMGEALVSKDSVDHHNLMLCKHVCWREAFIRLRMH